MMGMPAEPEILQPGAGLRQRIAEHQPNTAQPVPVTAPPVQRSAMLMAFSPRAGA